MLYLFSFSHSFSCHWGVTFSTYGPKKKKKKTRLIFLLFIEVFFFFFFFFWIYVLFSFFFFLFLFIYLFLLLLLVILFICKLHVTYIQNLFNKTINHSLSLHPSYSRSCFLFFFFFFFSSFMNNNAFFLQGFKISVCFSFFFLPITMCINRPAEAFHRSLRLLLDD